MVAEAMAKTLEAADWWRGDGDAAGEADGIVRWGFRLEALTRKAAAVCFMRMTEKIISVLVVNTIVNKHTECEPSQFGSSREEKQQR